MQNADDAGLRQPRMHLEAKRAKFFGDKSACLAFFEGNFGMRVDMVAPLSHFRNERRDFRNDFHGEHALNTISRSRDVSANLPRRPR